MAEPTPVQFTGSEGLILAGDVAGDPKHPVLMLLHGGGQARRSWLRTQMFLAGEGYRAYAIDQRGHGDSSWSPSKDYSLPAFTEDLRQVCGQLEGPPILVGASLGGLASILLTGESPTLARGLILVDMTHRPEAKGGEQVKNFMQSSPNGFASLEEASEVIAAYQPDRPRPKNLSGLERNLRRGDDGRWYWRWDPAFFTGNDQQRWQPVMERLERAVRKITVPTLLIRGGKSDVVSPESAAEFRALLPSAQYVEVPDAGHMITGDDNDVFRSSIVGFLKEVTA
jgi:pimeloyl-ACP methyl ester carboxylesterase